MLQPDLFHRAPPLTELLGGPVTLAAMGKVFKDPELRGKFMGGYYAPALAYENLTKTIGAVLEADVAGSWQIAEDCPLTEVLASESFGKLGAVMAVDREGVLRGVLTVDQVRRALQSAFGTPA